MNTNNRQQIALISVHGDPAVDIGGEEAGGQNVYVRQVGEALAQLGWEVDMFTRKTDVNQPNIVQHQDHCRTIRISAGPETFIPRQEIFEHCDRVVEGIIKFARQEGREYSLLHTNYWLSAWVGLELQRRLSLPIVHTYHSLGAVKYKSVQEPPQTATRRLEIEKAILENANCIVATSPQEEENLRSLVSSRGNIEIIPCGTNINHFGSISYQQAREKLGFSPKENIIFYIGRFDPRKGIETLVRAVANSKLRGQEPLRLIIGGAYRPGQSDGEEKERISKIVEELGLSDITEFPGRIADENLPTYFAAADVCVVPSHYEPFGLVPIEAMASGTPVVGSAVGGLNFTVVSEETGLLVPPKDNAAFTEAIDRILSDPQWRNQLGENARKRMEEKFSWEGVTSQLSDLYSRIINQRV
ncbi:glycosyltransferase family 1 protein [Euhalothece natronophila Z-M001]|uniref:Glycosyltransferase family 1 protein n=1 Tax=Euhalothece natronophila Z-M001 TaxID=522448 RepID=A0A5B8NNP9_9CHRO|nr:glycosyltransferase family 1 protein [Euhalothece natronophila]QDZ40566.1 glycosyltransferase family 1 protein [Euhalothece natronophila Z-M001]